MNPRMILKQPLLSDASNPHFAMVKYWDYFYLYMYGLGKYFHKESSFGLDELFKEPNNDPAYFVADTHGCVGLQGDWYEEDNLTKFVKQFEMREKYIVCIGVNDESFDSLWEWYSEGSKYPFVTYSKEETQGWAVWYLNHFEKEYPGTKEVLVEVLKKHFDPEESLDFIRKKITGELEWSFGLIDTKFEHQQAEWLRDSHQGLPL